MARYNLKYLEPSPPDLEQALESGSDFGDINGPSLKRKIRDENDTLHSFRDITNVGEASVPNIKLPPSKQRKLCGQSESFEERLTRSLAKIAQEVVVLTEALVRIKRNS
ncbi:hypothetical protein EV702DRAFT_1192006 [Suillus placidus]|uniref:Uncharacterized protein n=1 Tax=Suillus placidus TaxID=48579 RepID=A0A9P7A4J3_9AGAM|nr:hypothetical protein EV702DRAFT_1192006 [Suillus placidus]